ncbi:sigma-70 family RNA polymerase sigma factor [Nonomuraea longicatena]|uniref:Sigma-70 family RNA polymerase sigma factor n=1 Tax=Nonomuraea longicatena TaxID=83682 RepID=A0ABN1NWM9_9ACTN
MDVIADCYRTHAALVRSYLRRLVPPQDLDDVAQVVFAEAWRSRHRFDPGRDLAAWLLAIAHRRAVDHLRARRPPTIPLEWVAEPAGDDRDSHADRDRLRRAMAALPPAQREAIALAYFADLTQREIAARLRVPLGTVKARTARGLHRLHDLLATA